MTNHAEKLVQFLRGKRVGVFVDDANLYRGFRLSGWRMDIARLSAYVSSIADLSCLNLYLCMPGMADKDRQFTMDYVEQMRPYASVRMKPIKYYSNSAVRKANMDVEMALDVVRKLDFLDVVLLFTGDSDFLELKRYVYAEHGKGIIFAGYRVNMAAELRGCKHLYIDDLKKELELKR